MNEMIITNLIGVVTGIFTSILSWWYLFHFIKPKIVFSKYISKLPSKDEVSGWKYRFKFYNQGRRAIIDIQIKAKISIKGLQFQDSWYGTYVPLTLEGDTQWEILRIPRRTNRVLRLYLNLNKDLKVSPLYPEEIREKAIRNELTLDELLSVRPDTKLYIYIGCFDEFSGSRKVFMSEPFTLESIKEGRFKGMEVVPGTVENELPNQAL